MNPRFPIFAMLGLGLVAVIALSLFPSVLTTATRELMPVRAVAVAPSIGNAVLRPREPAPEFDAAAWYAQHAETPETHGLLIESLDHSRLFASHNADVTFNPASLIKLSTSLVALKQLGADYRFQTRVFTIGQVDKTGTLHGQLIVAGDDPTFGDLGASKIAGGLRSQGIKHIAGEVIVSPGFCFNFSESAADSGERLARALHLGNLGVTVGDEPAGAPLFVYRSNPLRDILLYMNARSSNFIAERIGAAVGGPAAVQQFLIDRLNLPADEVTISRTSGREHNRMTPRGLIAVIRALVEEVGRQGLEPSDIMAVASDDSGTLHRRLAGTGLEGAVVGKTGTLTSEVDGGMASLAGIVYTKDSGLIVFAILDRGNRISDNRQMEDQLLAEVVRSNTTPLPIASPTPRRLLPPSNVRLEENAE